MQETTEWLEELLVGLPEEQLADAIRQIRLRILESYRNGQAAGKPPASAPSSKGRTPSPTYRHGSRPVHRKSVPRERR